MTSSVSGPVIVWPPFGSRVLSRFRLLQEEGEGVSEGVVPAFRDTKLAKAMFAFALEETNDLTRAAKVAREVLDEDPTGQCVDVAGVMSM